MEGRGAGGHEHMLRCEPHTLGILSSTSSRIFKCFSISASIDLMVAPEPSYSLMYSSTFCHREGQEAQRWVACSGSDAKPTPRRMLPCNHQVLFTTLKSPRQDRGCQYGVDAPFPVDTQTGEGHIITVCMDQRFQSRFDPWHGLQPWRVGGWGGGGLWCQGGSKKQPWGRSKHACL